MFSSSTTNFTLIGARRRPLRCQKLTIRSNCEFSLVHTDISLPIRQKFACERVDLWCAFAYAEFHFDASCYPEGREIPKLNNEPSSIQCSQKVEVFKKIWQLNGDTIIIYFAVQKRDGRANHANEKRHHELFHSGEVRRREIAQQNILTRI